MVALPIMERPLAVAKAASTITAPVAAEASITVFVFNAKLPVVILDVPAPVTVTLVNAGAEVKRLIVKLSGAVKFSVSTPASTGAVRAIVATAVAASLTSMLTVSN